MTQCPNLSKQTTENLKNQKNDNLPKHMAAVALTDCVLAHYICARHATHLCISVAEFSTLAVQHNCSLE